MFLVCTNWQLLSRSMKDSYFFTRHSAGHGKGAEVGLGVVLSQFYAFLILLLPCAPPMQFTVPQVCAKLLSERPWVPVWSCWNGMHAGQPACNHSALSKYLLQSPAIPALLCRYSCPLEGQPFCQHAPKGLCLSLLSVNSIKGPENNRS